MGEESLALDEVLACIWPPEAMPSGAYAEAVSLVREWEHKDAREAGQANPETAEEYVDRLLHRRPSHR
jgi:hypothetical protein